MQDNFNDDITEMILRYMDDELPEEERTAFEKRLQEDGALNEQYQFLLSAKQAIRSYGVKQRVQNLYTEYASEKSIGNESAKIVQRTSSFKLFMRVAAAIIVIFSSYAVYQYGTTNINSVYNDNYVPYTLPVNRGDDNTSNVDSLYNAGNYTAALQALQNKPQKDQRDHFIEGQCNLQTGNTENAIQAFKQVESLNAQNHQRLYADETDYYLLLAFIKAGNIQDAKQKLDAITSNKQHLFYQNAEQIGRMKLKILELKQ